MDATSKVQETKSEIYDHVLDVEKVSYDVQDIGPWPLTMEDQGACSRCIQKTNENIEHLLEEILKFMKDVHFKRL